MQFTLQKFMPPARQMQIKPERMRCEQTNDRETNRRQRGQTKIPLALICTHFHHSDCREINSFLHHIWMNFLFRVFRGVSAFGRGMAYSLTPCHEKLWYTWITLKQGFMTNLNINVHQIKTLILFIYLYLSIQFPPNHINHRNVCPFFLIDNAFHPGETKRVCTFSQLDFILINVLIYQQKLYCLSEAWCPFQQKDQRAGLTLDCSILIFWHLENSWLTMMKGLTPQHW